MPHIFEPFFTSDDAAGRRPRPGHRVRAGRAHGRPARRDVAARRRRPSPWCFRHEAPRGVRRSLARLAAVAGCGGGGDGAPRPRRTPRRRPCRPRDAGVEVVERHVGVRRRASTPGHLPRARRPAWSRHLVFGARPDASSAARRQDGGLGSGFVLNGDGEIVTNAHVVTDGGGRRPAGRSTQVFVEFADGNRVPAEISGFDPDADVALIKIDPAGPRPAARCRSATIDGRHASASPSPRSARRSASASRCRSASSPRSTATCSP